MSSDPLAPFRATPQRAGVFLDFDGTLSHIVTDPAAARPVEGAAAALSDLTRHFGVVAIVSGRSAHQLLNWLGPDVEIWGLHGAERAVGGEIEVAEAAARYAPLMERVLDEARSVAGPEIVVEDKGVIVGLHYRAAEDRSATERDVERIAGELARRHRLLLGTGRLVVELRPPVEFSKAEVIVRRVRDLDLDRALFAGDDVVDLPAFDALDELEGEGVTVLRIAVDSDEAPAELLERADVVVNGPVGLVRWLRDLPG